MGSFKFVLFILIAFSVVSCSENLKPTEVDVYEIKNIGILSTSEFTIGKIVKLEDDKDWYKFGDRKILISCKAKVKAGINLMEIGDSTIEVKGKTIIIYLPPVQITSFEMDPLSVRTEMENVNGFRANFTQAEKNKILRLGEKSIRNQLDEIGIKEEAEKNAKAFVKNFYKELGFDEIIVKTTKVKTDEK